MPCNYNQICFRYCLNKLSVGKAVQFPDREGAYQIQLQAKYPIKHANIYEPGIREIHEDQQLSMG